MANEIVPRYRAEMQEMVRATSAKRLVFAASIPCRTLADFAAETGCELISNSPGLTAWLNGKHSLQTALQELGLPRIPGRWTRLTESRYGELSSDLGSRFVAQVANGASGSGTAFIQSADDYKSAGERFGGEPVWVTPDLGNLSVNINAVAVEAGTVVSCPSIQLEGLAVARASRGMYCGNDYIATASLGSSIVCNVLEQTERIGGWLASLGYRGLFGLDFVLDQTTSKAYAVDLNPRWQGSTAPLTLAEYKAGRLPLAAADLAYRMGLVGESEILHHRDEFLRPVRVSHLSLRCSGPGWLEVTGTLQPGVYSLSCEPSFVRPGLRLTDLKEPDEILVSGGVPRAGTWLAPGAHALRFTSEERMSDIDSLAAEKLYQLLKLVPARADLDESRD